MNFLAFAAQNARHEFTVDPRRAENEALDAHRLREMAEQRLRERNEELFTRAVRQWFAKTEEK